MLIFIFCIVFDALFTADDGSVLLERVRNSLGSLFFAFCFGDLRFLFERLGAVLALSLFPLPDLDPLLPIVKQ